MKTKITLASIIISLMVIIPNVASAQYRSFVLGIKAAPSIAWMNSNLSDYQSDGAKLGFSWGVVGDFYFAKNYAFSTGLNFLYTGGKLTYPDIRDNIDVDLMRDYRIRYLEIPAVLKLKTDEMGPFRYFGQIGLGFGVRMNSKGEDQYKVGGQTITVESDDFDKHTSLFRAAMILGIGIEYPFNDNTAGVVAINFNNGFTNALDENNIRTGDKHQARTNFLELSIGVMF